MKAPRGEGGWITAKQRKMFLEAIQDGMYRRACCALTGVNYGTFRQRISRAEKEFDEGRIDPQCPTQKFLLQVIAAEKGKERKWLNELEGCACDKRDWRGYQYLLERKDKHWRPAEKAVDEPTGVAGELKNKTTAELEAIAEEEE